MKQPWKNFFLRQQGDMYYNEPIREWRISVEESIEILEDRVNILEQTAVTFHPTLLGAGE